MRPTCSAISEAEDLPADLHELAGGEVAPAASSRRRGAGTPAVLRRHAGLILLPRRDGLERSRRPIWTASASLLAAEHTCDAAPSPQKCEVDVEVGDERRATGGDRVERRRRERECRAPCGRWLLSSASSLVLRYRAARCPTRRTGSTATCRPRACSAGNGCGGDRLVVLADQRLVGVVEVVLRRARAGRARSVSGGVAVRRAARAGAGSSL